MSELLQPTDRIFVAGSRGMAGSAICRALVRNGFGNSDSGGQLLSPVREELDLLSHSSVEEWLFENKPNVVVLAAAKVGGIYANDAYPPPDRGSVPPSSRRGGYGCTRSGKFDPR